MNLVKIFLSAAAICIGVLMVIIGAVPLIFFAILKPQMPSFGTIIASPDGTTAIAAAGMAGTGIVILVIIIGVLLTAAGIWGYRRCKG